MLTHHPLVQRTYQLEWCQRSWYWQEQHCLRLQLTLILADPSARADDTSEQSIRSCCSFSSPKLPEYKACECRSDLLSCASECFSCACHKACPPSM